MGSQQSNSSSIQTFWQPLNQQFINLPGRPHLVKSTRRSDLLAQRYRLQMINTNQQQQISIFRQRKISNQNIVPIYDFQIRKGLIGCARNADFYDIITQHFPYRLSNLTNLTNFQMLYIFHQSLNGYHQLFHYSRTCYPTSNMIAITKSAEIKIWINQNWSDNTSRSARNQKSQIQTLWNTIKLCGDAKTLHTFHNAYYQLPQIKFESCINLLRTSFLKQLIQASSTIQLYYLKSNNTITQFQTQSSFIRIKKTIVTQITTRTNQIYTHLTNLWQQITVYVQINWGALGTDRKQTYASYYHLHVISQSKKYHLLQKIIHTDYPHTPSPILNIYRYPLTNLNTQKIIPIFLPSLFLQL